jgi:hypothetical protein
VSGGLGGENTFWKKPLFTTCGWAGGAGGAGVILSGIATIRVTGSGAFGGLGGTIIGGAFGFSGCFVGKTFFFAKILRKNSINPPVLTTRCWTTRSRGLVISIETGLGFGFAFTNSFSLSGNKFMVESIIIKR